MFQQKMEAMSMILMPQMAKLMQKHIVLQHLRKTHYIQIQIDIRSGRTTAPVGCVMLDSHTVIGKTITLGKNSKPRREFCLRLLSQDLDLIRRRHMDILIFLLLTCHGLQYPVTTHLVEGTCCSIGHDVRKSYRHPLGRMYPYAYATAPDTTVEEHITDLRIG